MQSLTHNSLLLTLLIASSLSAQRIILFDHRVDTEEKTEIRYDLPPDCVITGLGFRAAYDNITTMYCRYHRLRPDGRLTDPHHIRLGSEPNHPCEAEILLPEPYVAVGFGAAGEPEWDVTHLRIWARPLQPDGTLGPLKLFTAGFKPNRSCERQFLLTEPDRLLTGIGLRFHLNDIQGLYAASKALLRLDVTATTSLSKAVRHASLYHLTRLDLYLPQSILSPRSTAQLRKHLSSVPELIRTDKLSCWLWLATSTFSQLETLLDLAPFADGLVLDLRTSPEQLPSPTQLAQLHEFCSSRGLTLALRLPAVTASSPENLLSLLSNLPPRIALIIDPPDPHSPQKLLKQLPSHILSGRTILIQPDLLRTGTGRADLPDLRIDELAGQIVHSALASATGFIVRLDIDGKYLPDTVNILALQALHRLADDPLQPTDELLLALCSRRFGPAARHAASALNRTARINDLIFNIFNLPVLCRSGRILPFDQADSRLSTFCAALGPALSSTQKLLCDPNDKTLHRADQQKQTAQWLLVQSLADANQALHTHPTPAVRQLYDALVRLQSTLQLHRQLTRAFLLAKIYAIDGAPSTRHAAEQTLAELQNISHPSPTLAADLDTFIASTRLSLQRSDHSARLTLALQHIRQLTADHRYEAATEALRDLIDSDRFAPHLPKRNHDIARLACLLPTLALDPASLTLRRGADGQWHLRKQAGRWSLVCGPGAPCIYLAANITPPNNQPADYLLSFEYFDKGTHKLYFEYNSAYPADQNKHYHPAQPLQLTNTNQWKKGSFILSNAQFTHAQNCSADMRFVSGQGVCIRAIRLRPR